MTRGKQVNNCIFCKIVNKEISSNCIYEDDDMIIIKDINPIAKKHFLAIPKLHFSDVVSMSEDNAKTIGKMLKTIGAIADSLLELEKGFRIVMNKGEHGCQSVFHLHLHILGGEQLSPHFN